MQLMIQSKSNFTKMFRNFYGIIALLLLCILLQACADINNKLADHLNSNTKCGNYEISTGDTIKIQGKLFVDELDDPHFKKATRILKSFDRNGIHYFGVYFKNDNSCEIDFIVTNATSPGFNVEPGDVIALTIKLTENISSSYSEIGKPKGRYIGYVGEFVGWDDEFVKKGIANKIKKETDIAAAKRKEEAEIAAANAAEERRKKERQERIRREEEWRKANPEAAAQQDMQKRIARQKKEQDVWECKNHCFGAATNSPCVNACMRNKGYDATWSLEYVFNPFMQ